MKILMGLPILLLVLAGCTTSTPEFVTPEQDEEGRYLIDMTSALTFSPAKAEIPLGENGTVTIRFVHGGGGAHDVRSETDAWSPSPMITDGSWDLTLDATGDFEYFCNPHKANGMTGTLRIV